jgi:hypothetical protein
LDSMGIHFRTRELGHLQRALPICWPCAIFIEAIWPRTPAEGLEATLPRRQDDKPQNRHYSFLKTHIVLLMQERANNCLTALSSYLVWCRSILMGRELRKTELFRRLGNGSSHVLCVNKSLDRIQSSYKRSITWAVVH